MVVRLRDVVVNAAMEVASQNRLGCRLCRSAGRTGQSSVNRCSIRVADRKDQRQLWGSLVALIGKANPNCESAWKRIPVREDFSQDRGAKGFCLSFADMAFE
ncbi:MAG TPA: hypothetical protein VLJ58_00650 [Ramlibacter sp.]|nr:hypothetical protein [Ramlibacter sp.]